MKTTQSQILTFCVNESVGSENDNNLKSNRGFRNFIKFGWLILIAWKQLNKQL